MPVWQSRHDKPSCTLPTSMSLLISAGTPPELAWQSAQTSSLSA